MDMDRPWLEAKDKFKETLDDWYKTVENEDDATQFNCFWNPLFEKIKHILIEHHYSEKINQFNYSKDKIKKMQESMPDYSYCMKGIEHDLIKLKELLPVIYQNLFFCLSCWVGECSYHGWDWSKDNGDMKMQKQLTDDLTDKCIEIYAIVTKALDSNKN